MAGQGKGSKSKEHETKARIRRASKLLAKEFDRSPPEFREAVSEVVGSMDLDQGPSREALGKVLVWLLESNRKLRVSDGRLKAKNRELSRQNEMLRNPRPSGFQVEQPDAEDEQVRRVRRALRLPSSSSTRTDRHGRRVVRIDPDEER